VGCSHSLLQQIDQPSITINGTDSEIGMPRPKRFDLGMEHRDWLNAA
jgi:hypothetical protein